MSWGRDQVKEGEPSCRQQRVTDMHTCPIVTAAVPHVGGPILPLGAVTVLIGFLRRRG